MIKQAIVLIVLSMMILAANDITTEPQAHELYLPIVTVDRCKYKDRAGVGWAATGASSLTPLCGSWYYHIGWWRNLDSYLLSGGIPILWCDYDSRGDYYSIARDVLTESYTGYVIVMNEPDRPEQCNRSPDEAARIAHTFFELLPNAKLILPNTVHVEYLGAFLDSYYAAYGEYPNPYRWGMHNYTGNRSASEEIAIFCGELTSRGIECTGNIWMTEFGSCSQDTLREKTGDIISSAAIEKFAVYTDIGYAEHCFDLLDLNRNLTALGAVYIDEVTK